MDIISQKKYRIRCEWSEMGLELYGPVSDVVVIVDVLSFTTDVEVAVSRGAVILPFPMKDNSATEYAKKMNAKLAGRRGSDGYSLSPVSLMKAPAGERIVLPSPNGSNLSRMSTTKTTIAGCLRNAKSVADYINKLEGSVTVIPAGEKWRDGSLRRALDDILGAGAVISHLSGNKSPEAQTAAHLYAAYKEDLQRTLLNCTSGVELVELGFREDVLLASELNVGTTVPKLVDGVYTG